MKAGSADTGDVGAPFGINLAVGTVIMLGASVVAGALFPAIAARLLVLAISVAAFATLVDDTRAAVATAGLGYLVFDGFLVNRYGELTWDGTPSVLQVTMLALAVGLGRAWRAVRSTGRWGAGRAERPTGRPAPPMIVGRRCVDPPLRGRRSALPAPRVVGSARGRLSSTRVPDIGSGSGSGRFRNG